jgi:hypothetical protein
VSGIENDLQLGITYRAMEGFMDSLMARARTGRPPDVPLEIWRAQHDALVSVMLELRGQIADYLEKKK